jgi:hypothetical protein
MEGPIKSTTARIGSAAATALNRDEIVTNRLSQRHQYLKIFLGHLG